MTFLDPYNWRSPHFWAVKLYAAIDTCQTSQCPCCNDTVTEYFKSVL